MNIINRSIHVIDYENNTIHARDIPAMLPNSSRTLMVILQFVIIRLDPGKRRSSVAH